MISEHVVIDFMNRLVLHVSQLVGEFIDDVPQLIIGTQLFL